MGIVKQLINFATSGLDYDSDKRVFGPGDSDLRVNVTTDELGRQFVISNIKGTTEKAHSFLTRRIVLWSLLYRHRKRI
jgi:hypothetical protein